MALKGIRIYGHKVSSEFISNVLLFETDEKWLEKLREVVHISVEIEELGLRAKYPIETKEGILNPAERFSKEKAEELCEKAGKVIRIIKEYLKERFGVEVS